MIPRFKPLKTFPARHPFAASLVFVLLCVAGYLSWLGGRELWLRQQRKNIDQALVDLDFAKARGLLARCLRQRPGDVELRLLAARTARRDGDLDSARAEIYQIPPKARHASRQVALELQLIEAQGGLVKAELDSLIEALEMKHPQSEEILEALTMAFVQTYQLERAMFWCGELLEKWPKNGIGRLIRAQTADTQGRRDRAIEQLRELVADAPAYVKARTSLADLFYKSQRYREALLEYQILHTAQPNELVPLLGVASCYDRLGMTEEARPFMRQLEERFPGNSEAQLEAGRFALNQDRPDDARRMLQTAVEIAPFDNEVHRELGICLRRLDRLEESQKHLDRSREIEADLSLLEKKLTEMAKAPDDPTPRREAGEICLRNGQRSEAIRWLFGALELAPRDRRTHQILADYYSSLGDRERALFHQSQAVSGK